jgi:hypothetical protein
VQVISEISIASGGREDSDDAAFPVARPTIVKVSVVANRNIFCVNSVLCWTKVRAMKAKRVRATKEPSAERRETVCRLLLSFRRASSAAPPMPQRLERAQAIRCLDDSNCYSPRRQAARRCAIRRVSCCS